MSVRASAVHVLAAVALTGCASAPSSPEDRTDEANAEAADDDAPEQPTVMPTIDRVATMLAGRFDSTAQAARDSRYYGVSLRACPISLDAFSSHSLYVEQAMVDSLEAPYRQRAYVLETQGDGSVVSSVFELEQPGRFVGLCDDSSKTAPALGDLIARDGCSVTLTEQDGAFVGGTTGKGCESSLNGAAYATSEVTLTETQIRSWDRGYDANDAQVWGAQAGPYEFDRQE